MRKAYVLLALGLLGLVGCAAPSGWDPQAAESLKQEPIQFLKNLDSGDFLAIVADADSNVVIMDVDENNAPFRTDGIAEARAFMSHMAEVAKSQGLKFTSTLLRNDAWATPTMGYSVVEYNQTITAGGQTMGPFKFRGTMVARREGNRWIMTHWHGSFAAVPTAPAMPDSAAK